MGINSDYLLMALEFCFLLLRKLRGEKGREKRGAGKSRKTRMKKGLFITKSNKIKLLLRFLAIPDDSNSKKTQLREDYLF